MSVLKLIKNLLKKFIYTILLAWAISTFIISAWTIFKGFIFTTASFTEQRAADMMIIDTYNIPFIAFWAFVIAFASGMLLGILTIVMEYIRHTELPFGKEDKFDMVRKYVDKRLLRINREIRRTRRH